ncbi:uncharacterized protein SPPG_06646 [Spizellomyces punctatus DAOM BR117]|uniref:Chromatin modification-related protein n=1 Tax=Spizellomyces punctatus (strain DAOM BR117) TaxID=645134 RepID=A0A0L0HAP7_SPIPD|nr:uncharacterized protein SPPG_06646 [Spizellomyces punctatus DAOM BR117]KNC98247.1 hypothetical protein SPPG_06646 [Spizellomyces punctatus DAOM BR117]|eukprot:XP_016606287.1 hypothetical protein SPPG_06646 [Spizellomyces punctatus DAOM BR117]
MFRGLNSLQRYIPTCLPTWTQEYLDIVEDLSFEAGRGLSKLKEVDRPCTDQRKTLTSEMTDLLTNLPTLPHQELVSKMRYLTTLMSELRSLVEERVLCAIEVGDEVEERVRRLEGVCEEMGVEPVLDNNKTYKCPYGTPTQRQFTPSAIHRVPKRDGQLKRLFGPPRSHPDEEVSLGQPPCQRIPPKFVPHDTVLEEKKEAARAAERCEQEGKVPTRPRRTGSGTAVSGEGEVRVTASPVKVKEKDRDKKRVNGGEAPMGKRVKIKRSKPSVYCFCKEDIGPEAPMIECSTGSACPAGHWFHFICVDVTKAPRGKWWCPGCRDR